MLNEWNCDEKIIEATSDSIEEDEVLGKTVTDDVIGKKYYSHRVLGSPYTVV